MEGKSSPSEPTQDITETSTHEGDCRSQYGTICLDRGENDLREVYTVSTRSLVEKEAQINKSDGCCICPPFCRCGALKNVCSSFFARVNSLPDSKLRRGITLLLVAQLLWGASFCVFGKSVAPGSPTFTLVVVLLLAYGAGWLLQFINLPPLLGMLIVGIILRNIHFVSIEGGNNDKDFVFPGGSFLNRDLVSSLRQISLVVILTRAGLGLDAGALVKLSGMVLRLAFTPCIVETLSIAVASHFILGMPWLWGLLLGSVIAAVSPAVVVPCLLSLEQRGFGVDKGIPTLVIAAASIDDILAISIFGVILGIVFSEGNLTSQLLQGPLDVIIGLSYGILSGFIFYIFPSTDDRNVVLLRSIFIAAGGLLALFGSEIIGFSGAGPLGCITAAFVASTGWKQQGWEQTHPVTTVFSGLWEVFQPVLFSMIGIEISFIDIDIHVILLGLATLICGVLIRLITTFFVVIGGRLSLKERLFVALAWLPKATVQAALGPVALDTALQNGGSPEAVQYGKIILTIAILSILITAPIGAVAILKSGPSLLHQTLPNDQTIRISRLESGQETASL